MLDPDASVRTRSAIVHELNAPYPIAGSAAGLLQHQLATPLKARWQSLAQFLI
jgi:hypothetical protein